MLMKEIGSEFWLTHDHKIAPILQMPRWLNLGNDNKLLLSGRTAIDFVIRDILINREINTVYFPSYCCQSMLQPFINHGIEIILYEVDLMNTLRININPEQQCDVFFAMNYFGFSQGRMDNYIEIFKKRNIIVIEDATHSLLSNTAFNNQSDYIIASLRKWFPIISGGLAVKSVGEFNINHKDITSEEMVKTRKRAMLQKGKFINGDISINKEYFLKQYNEANELLDNDYELYRIDSDSYHLLQEMDIEKIINTRIKNAEELYKKIITNKHYKLLFDILEQGDCPLFVPIVFNNELERDSLRTYLVNNKVYCPIHWPKPEISNNNTDNIYNRELSLIVDQRYDVTAMQIVMHKLSEYYD